MSTTIITLQWEKMESQFTLTYMAKVPGLDCIYFVSTERETGRTFSTGIDRSGKYYHLDTQQAKQWCQHDFESKIRALIRSS